MKDLGQPDKTGKTTMEKNMKKLGAVAAASAAALAPTLKEPGPMCL